MTVENTHLLSRCRGKGLSALGLAAILAATNIAMASLAVTRSDSYPVIRDDCAIATPSLTLSPTGNQSREPGSNQTYTLSITNNDNVSCSASNFDLTITYLPKGWTGDLSPKSMHLTPGATGTATLSMTSANDAPNDNYKLQVGVSNAREATHAKTATTIYAVNDTAMLVDTVATAAEQTEHIAGETNNPVNHSPGPGDEVTVPASSGGMAAMNDHAEKAERQTLRLTGLLTAYQKASGSAKEHALNDLVAAAEERHALLAGLIAEDPGAVLRAALPPQIRARMPEEVQPLVEQHTALKGNLAVLYEDFEDGSHHLRHFLENSGERYELHFETHPPEILSGTEVQADGVLLDHAVALASAEQNILLLTDDGSTTDPASAPSSTELLPDTLGAQRTVVLLVNFPQQPEQPWTVEEARNVVFGSASDFFRENSHGQTWLEGDVFGWFTIDVDVASCPSMDIALEAERAAEAQGIDLSGYKRFIYAFPDIGCRWAGQATVGSVPTLAWFDGTLMTPETATHEVGHNFGLHHSHALECGPDAVGADCASLEYGDVLDRMGGSFSGHFNAFQKRRLGWLDNGNSPPSVAANDAGTYVLEPYALAANGTKAVRVLRDEDAQSGQRRWYHLEFRQAVGFDSYLSNAQYGESVLNGIVVRLATEGEPNSSYLLDMTPNTQKYDWNDLALAVGETFTDAAAGVSIRTDSVGPSGATVSVSYDQPQCVRAAPQVSVSPSQSAWLAPGAAFSYDLVITNADTEACGESQFNLLSTVPGGWIATLESESLLVAAGTTGSTVLTVTSTTSAEDGFYEFVVSAENAGDPGYAGTVGATHIVNADAANDAPTPLDDAATTSIDSPVIIDVLANDTDPDGDPLNVTTVSQGNYGVANINPDGTLTYMPGARFKKSDTFLYRVSDGIATADAVVSVKARNNGGKGGGGKGKGPGR